VLGGEVLEPLGFSPLEQRAYDLVVARGRLSLADLVATSDVAPELQREAIDTLVAHGLVRQLSGSDREYVVAPPEQAIEVLISRRMSELQAVRARAAEVAVRARRAAQVTDPVELIEVVAGPGSVRSVFLQGMSGAREELLAFDRPPYATDPDEALRVQQERVAVADGLRIRVVYDKTLLEDPAHTRRFLESARTIGEERRLAAVPLKMVVVDREWALLPLLDAGDERAEAGLIVRQSVLLDSLIALFESVWAQAAEVTPADGEPAVAGTAERELREIAHLLAIGMTDVAISHHLRISERTVRRRIKDLMDELRVDSRYHAGVRAAQRGWA
jgi:DNA-binding CsgD family transcriptional regulator